MIIYTLDIKFEASVDCSSMRYCRRQLIMQKWNQEQRSLNKVYELILGAGVVFSKLRLNFLHLYIFLDKVHGSPRFTKRSVSVCYSFTHDVSISDTLHLCYSDDLYGYQFCFIQAIEIPCISSTWCFPSVLEYSRPFSLLLCNFSAPAYKTT